MPGISRKQFLESAASGLAGIAGIVSSGCAPGIVTRQYDKPNIVYVTIDTQRYDRLGFNGYGRDTSPFLDTFPGKGVVFDSHYSQSHFTLHSIASMMASVYVRDTGASRTNFQYGLQSDDNVTLAEILKAAGYQNFGAVSMSSLDSKRRFDRGFDAYSEISYPKRLGSETVRELQTMVSTKADKRNPLFIWCHIFDPHAPYDAPDEFQYRFQTERIPGDEKVDVISFAHPRASFKRLTRRQILEFSDRYDGQVRFADHNVESLISFLVREKLFDFANDLFVLNADHGENLGEHGGCSSHTGLYETTTHIPMVMAGAGLPKGKRVDALTMNIDVPSTILEMAGIKRPSVWKGKSLVGIIRGAEPEVNKAVFGDSIAFDAVSVRTENLKYIHRESPKNQESKKRQGSLYPKGYVEFYGGYPSVFEMQWPCVPEDQGDSFTEISFSYTVLVNFKCKMKYQNRVNLNDKSDLLVVRNGHCFKNITFPVFQEDAWNASAALNTKFHWRVQIFRGAGNDEEILYDSGKQWFRLKPTQRFCELYDVAKDPGEERNIIRTPQYAERLSAMEVLAKNFVSGTTFEGGKESTDKVQELDEQDTRNLRALGYI